MTGILKDFPFAIAYLDDIIIFSKTLQEHLSHIHMVFEKLRAANLSMKKSKCNFFSKEIQYLGHILSTTGIRPLPSKTHAIQHMSSPTMPKQVRAFLGLVGYYRKFIKGFTKIAKPLTLLTRQQTTKQHLNIKKMPLFKHRFCITPIATKLTFCTQMLWMTHNFPKNMMEWNFL